ELPADLLARETRLLEDEDVRAPARQRRRRGASREASAHHGDVAAERGLHRRRHTSCQTKTPGETSTSGSDRAAISRASRGVYACRTEAGPSATETRDWKTRRPISEIRRSAGRLRARSNATTARRATRASSARRTSRTSGAK